VKLPPQNRPRLLAPAQEQLVRRAWAAGVRRDEVARLAGISIHVLEARFRDQLRDLPRRPRGVGGGHRGGDPTPDEIAERAAEVRSLWSEDRWLGRPPDDGPR
jgi:hypothetical protein